MKRSLFIFVLTLVAGLSSIFLYVYATPPGYDYSLSVEYKEKEPLPAFNEVDEILQWMDHNLRYISDGNVSEDYWQTPEETLLAGGGDCEDLSLLFMYLLKHNLNLKSELLLVKVDGRSSVGHAIVQLNDDWYELTTFEKIHYRGRFDVAYGLPYVKSLYSAEKNHFWSPDILTALRQN